MARPLKPETAFAARLVEARRHMDRDEFAAVLGVPKSTLGNWERGRTFPPPEMLTKMSEVLGVSLDWLISGHGAMRPTEVKHAELPQDDPLAPLFDADLHGRIVEGVMAVYKEEGAGLPPRHLGQLAAQLHFDLVAAYLSSAEERAAALKFALEKLRRELRSTGTGNASSKRSA